MVFRKIKIGHLIFGIIIWASLIFCLVSPTDPDLGFHIRIGQRFVTELKLPTDTWFNQPFQNSGWIAHEIVAESLIYLVWQLGQFIALTIFFSLIMVAVAYLLLVRLKPKSASWLTHVPIALLTLCSLTYFTGVRLQLFSWLFVSILYLGYFAWKQQKPWPLWLWTIIFLVWANLHNSLVFALGLMFLFALFNLITNKISNWIYWVKVFFIGAIASIIQPNLWRAHLEFWRTLTDNYKINIAEWQPTDINHSAGLLFIIIFIMFFISLLFIKREDIPKIDIPLFLIAVVMFFFGLMNLRNIPLSLICLLPVFSKAIYLVVGKIGPSEIPGILPRVTLILVNTGLIAGLIIIANNKWQTAASAYRLAEEGRYPIEAVRYLKDNKFPSGNVFNDYGWGGYLVYYFPEYRWFIDGRLPHLPIKNPLKPSEKLTALEVYQRLSNLGNDTDRLLDYYQINWVLVKRNSKLAIYLKKVGWRVLHQDKRSVILENN